MLGRGLDRPHGRSASGIAEQCSGILDQQQQVQWIGWGRLELEVGVDARASSFSACTNIARTPITSAARTHRAIASRNIWDSSPLPCSVRSIANRDNRITGTGSGMLRRIRPGAELRSTAAEASA